MSDLMHGPAVTLGSHANSRSTGRSIADNHRIAATPVPFIRHEAA